MKNEEKSQVALYCEQVDVLMKNFENLKLFIKAIQQKLEIAEKRVSEAEKQMQLYNSEQYLHNNMLLNEQRYIVLPNLEKKNEEAIYDAISFFGKKCPYCDANLYDGHSRKKIEVDHYIPVSKGGQDVPWNILPTCKKCNRAKKNKLPEVFLGPVRKQNCDNYLNIIRKKLVDEIQIQIEQYQQVRNFFMEYHDKISSLQKADFREFFVALAKLLNIELKSSDSIANTRIEALPEFINACCYSPEELAHNTRVKFKDMYDSFSDWLFKTYGDYPPKKKEFSARLAERYRRKNVGGQVWFYGVMLLPVAKRNV